MRQEKGGRCEAGEGRQVVIRRKEAGLMQEKGGRWDKKKGGRIEAGEGVRQEKGGRHEAGEGRKV